MSIPTAITVLIPVYNAAGTIVRCIDSVTCQSFDDLEILTIDDGSTDQSAELIQTLAARDSRVKLLVNPVNEGVTSTLAKGVVHARAPYIARLDADDWCHPKRIEKQLSYLQKNNADICFCSAFIHDFHKTRRTRTPTAGYVKWQGLFSCAYGIHPASMFRRDRIIQLGNYDTAFPVSQDYDLWDRASSSELRIAYQKNPLVHYDATDRSRISVAKQGLQNRCARLISMRAISRQFPNLSQYEKNLFRDFATGSTSLSPADTVIATEIYQNALKNVLSNVETKDRKNVASAAFRQLTSRMRWLYNAEQRTGILSIVPSLLPYLTSRDWLVTFPKLVVFTTRSYHSRKKH